MMKDENEMFIPAKATVGDVFVDITEDNKGDEWVCVWSTDDEREAGVDVKNRTIVLARDLSFEHKIDRMNINTYSPKGYRTLNETLKYTHHSDEMAKYIADKSQEYRDEYNSDEGIKAAYRMAELTGNPDRLHYNYYHSLLSRIIENNANLKKLKVKGIRPLDVYSELMGVGESNVFELFIPIVNDDPEEMVKYFNSVLDGEECDENIGKFIRKYGLFLSTYGKKTRGHVYYDKVKCINLCMYVGEDIKGEYYVPDEDSFVPYHPYSPSTLQDFSELEKVLAKNGLTNNDIRMWESVTYDRFIFR